MSRAKRSSATTPPKVDGQSLERRPAQDATRGMPALLRVPDVCEMLALSARKVAQLTATGELPSVRIGKSVRYSRDAVARWLADRGRHEATAARAASAVATSQRAKAAPVRSAPSVGPVDDSGLLRVLDVCRALAVSRFKLWQLTTTGELPCVRFGKAVRYQRASVARLIAERSTKRQDGASSDRA